MEDNARYTVFFYKDSSSNEGAAHNGNLLSCSGQTKISFQLVSKQCGNNFAAAIGSNTCYLVPIYRLIAYNRRVRVDTVTDIGQQLGQCRFAVNALHFSIENIGRLVALRLCIEGKKRANDIP